jgi:hypothetical protein
VKPFHFNTSNCRPFLKGAALLVFIATPGPLLLLPLVAWWMAHKGQRPLNTALRFSMNAVRTLA